MSEKKSEIIVKRFVVGILATNCYLVADPVTGECCIIDPGDVSMTIDKVISDNNFKLKFIINTHGHGDHIAANSLFNVPIYIHSLDAPCLLDPAKNLSGMFMDGVISPKAEKLLKDGDVLRLGSFNLKVLHTPGHTVGSISIVLDDMVFTGDALFAGSVGRADLPGGDEDLLIRSISDKLLTLDDNVVVYPGHGPDTTIGEERRSNPFLS